MHESEAATQLTLGGTTPEVQALHHDKGTVSSQASPCNPPPPDKPLLKRLQYNLYGQRTD